MKKKETRGEFEEHGEDEPDKANGEQRAFWQVAKPRREQINDHEEEQRASEDADLTRVKIAHARHQEKDAERAVGKFHEKKYKPNGQRFGGEAWKIG